MKKILFILALFCAVQVTAQDVHFTQYFTSPLTLNPANTGLVNCDYRVAGNYRSQWGSINSVPYMTGTISYDMPLIQNKRNGDVFGAGILSLYDKSGSAAFQNTTVGLSFAYHKSLSSDQNRPHTLSIGVQGTQVRKSINVSKLIFEDMVNPLTGQPIQPTAEFVSGMESYSDYNAGIMYSGRVSDFTSLYGGVSYYHITRPNESFLGEDYQLPSRITASLGGSYQMSENMIFYGSAAYQKQGTAYEVLVGGAAGFVLNPYHEDDMKSTVFYLGAWYRYNDAIAPYIGFEWTKAKLGISYDVNLSSLTEATQGQGALEVSLIYNGCFISNDRTTYNFACPRF